MNFYVDTCIYLNLWLKEKSKQDLPLWRYAKEFFESVENSGLKIYYSGIILKELSYILTKEEFNKKRVVFNSPIFEKLILSKEELNLARYIESELKYEISFYDIIHLLLAKKSNSILITRDRKLLYIAKNYSVTAKRPENIL